MTSRRQEANGHDPDDDESDDLLSELVATIRRIDVNVGHSPDPVLGHPGSGLCKAVAVLQAESDFRSRLEAERKARGERWKSRLQSAYALIGGAAIVLGAAWGLIRLIIRLAG